MMKKNLLLSLLLTLATCFTASSQALDSVFVQYSNPGVNQVSEVVANIYLPTQGAIRFGYTAIQQTDTLFVTACYSSGPMTAPMLLRDTMQLGTVPSNIQKLRFRAYYSSNPMQCDSTRFFEKTIAFSVKNPTGISEFSPAPVIQFYPNPVRETLTIARGAFRQINIREITGKLLFSQPARSGTDTHLQMSWLPPGLYLLETVSENGVLSRARLVKK
ncbi:T9SS type A sorting domain-containing protein [Adhaeribacter terreus]|uniref:T9SS type A sorting domain-containing protein n=1 Tax=Adhaeribacter terreus TaxID=529703 RepID=A0ABW0EA70_9BACT